MARNIVSNICIALLSIGSGYLIVDKINTNQSQELLEKEYQWKDDEIQRLKQDTAELKKSFKKDIEALEQAREKSADVFGEDTPAPEVLTESPGIENIVGTGDCRWINNKVINFFSYLDTREYIKEYQLKNGTYAYFKNISSKLYEDKPMVGEKNFPEGILKNAYHFYRTISKRNIVLIKDIFEKEKDIVEQTIDYFYQQQIHCSDTEMFLPPFDALYEYSNFFLNTLGGTAYLFRLDSRMRILLFYYSTMIIHEANMREINKYGIDIRPYIKILEDDLNSYAKFNYSDKYMREIQMVKKNYHMLSPTGSS